MKRLTRVEKDEAAKGGRLWILICRSKAVALIHWRAHFFSEGFLSECLSKSCSIGLHPHCKKELLLRQAGSFIFALWRGSSWTKMVLIFKMPPLHLKLIDIGLFRWEFCTTLWIDKETTYFKNSKWVAVAFLRKKNWVGNNHIKCLT